MSRAADVVVVGAGAFGGWAALHLRRRGATVLLLDAWGAAHPLSSSAGETRIFRCIYPQARYVELAGQALHHWRALEAQCGRPLLLGNGVLWMAGRPGPDEHACHRNLQAAGVPHDWVDADGIKSLMPWIKVPPTAAGILDRQGGVLLAYRACQAVVGAFVAAGGLLVTGTALGVEAAAGKLVGVRLADGSVLPCGAVLFAGGPWMPGLFPDLLGQRLCVTRQEVFYLGRPAAAMEAVAPGMPPWAYRGRQFWYGIPGGPGDEFKVACHQPGAIMDPGGERLPPAPASRRRLRRFLARRFPRLGSATLSRTEVCAYTSSPDGAFVLDRVPGSERIWLAAAGSGHGFKHAPALGELLARAILDGASLPEEFSLGRISRN